MNITFDGGENRKDCGGHCIPLRRLQQQWSLTQTRQSRRLFDGVSDRFDGCSKWCSARTREMRCGGVRSNPGREDVWW